ncbi:MAG TPA: hypothetical protein VGQ99_19845 [Tepidisphaeraceae bacterium]|jgi:uncharacterized membrane protein|nr:hypothetical protein [Tepidisphaeraceae bacterium]
MPYWLYDIVYPLSRWLHIVCTTLIVGGTLFFELVLPIAIEDLKREQQLYVFARARLVFRWVVWIGVIGLLISGGVSLYRMWRPYQLEEFGYVSRWAFSHVGLGALGMVVGLLLTIGRQPPENPVRWMRLNLVILLVVIFLGSATRHFQLSLTERPHSNRQINTNGWNPFEPLSRPSTQPTTAPATNPTTRPAP